VSWAATVDDLLTTEIAVTNSRRFRESCGRLTQHASFLLTKPRSKTEYDNADDRTDGHDNQSEPEIQLIQDQQRQKRHGADLKTDSKVVEHRIVTESWQTGGWNSSA